MTLPFHRFSRWAFAALGAAGLAAAGWYFSVPHLPPTGKIYVADTFGDDVGVIDVATGQKKTLMHTGKLPHNFALTRDRKRLYVTESGSQSVSVFDTDQDARVLQRMVGPIPDNPEHRKVGLDKVRQAHACNTCHINRSVGSFISGVTLSPDESELWFTEMKTQKITIVDAATLATKRQIEVLNPLGTTPSNLVVHPHTREIYVLSRTRAAGKTAGFDHDPRRGKSYVTIYDPGFRQVVGRIEVPYAVPYGAVFSPDGGELYVTYRSTNKIAVFDTRARKLLRSYDVDEAPIGLLLAPDDETLMVANFYETPATVQFLDRATGRIKHTLPVPSSPTLMVRHPHTGLVYMTASGSNKIVEIDPRKPAVTRVFDAGAYPVDVQIVP